MSQQNVREKCFTAGEALAIFRRVKLDSDSGVTVVYADAGEAAIGITQEPAASGAPVNVLLNNAGGTRVAVAAEVLAAGAALYGGNDGKVQDTSTGTSIGTALEAATADGDEIEILPA